VIKRTNNGSFLDNGVPSQIWDLVFTNTGSSAITAISISITTASGTSVNQDNKWNLEYFHSSHSYSVDLYGSLTSPGAQFFGAGFVVAGATSEVPDVDIRSVSC